MRRTLVGMICLAGTIGAARSEIVSEYTEFDTQRTCTVTRASDEGDGDWADLVCDGYRGYPVLLTYSDLRETAFYGFLPGGEIPRQPGFHPFNRAGPRIEWRIDRQERVAQPYAAIHRWFVSAGEDGVRDTEILVVSKVATLEDRSGCVVGYVMGTGNPQANEEARRIADENARSFACGTEAPSHSDPATRDLVSQ